MSDTFRPRREPAQSIYDAFQAEAKKRDGRSVDEWLKAERNAVWVAARDYTQRLGLRVPTMAEIELAECCASGHTDYGAQWAYGVERRMCTPQPGDTPMTEAERLAQALENACRDWDGRELKKPVATCTELRQAAAELRRLSADAQRLDYLDARNARKNERHGTRYGWRLNENCNRLALEDHAWPPIDVRAAIDQAMGKL